MSMLEGRKAYLPLNVNQKYHVVLRTYQEYEPTEAIKAQNPDATGFITFKYTLVEDGREISDNRTFPVGTDILARQLLAQTGLPNATSQIDLFRHCIENQTSLEMWVTQNGQYFNHTFQEPTATATTGTPTANQAVDNEDFH